MGELAELLPHRAVLALVRGLLYGLTPSSPTTLVTVALLLAGVSLMGLDDPGRARGPPAVLPAR